jgi:hypothetical protein
MEKERKERIKPAAKRRENKEGSAKQRGIWSAKGRLN